MHRVKPADSAPVGPAASTGRNPVEIARETLRMLMLRKLTPTPDHYQRVYEEISGIESPHADETLAPMLGALQDLPRGDPTLKEPVARLQRALVSRNWKAFGAEIRALRQAPEGQEQGELTPADGVSWPDTIRELLKQFELRHASVSPLDKRERLERVLGAFGHSPVLKDRLFALASSWQSTRGSEDGHDATASSCAGVPPALPASGAADAAGLAMPLAAGALARLDVPGAPLSSAETLRRLLAEVLRHDVAPRFAIEPSLSSELAELADLAATADSAEACAQLSTRLDAFWKGSAESRRVDVSLVPDLMGLVRLLVENMGELVDDDRWMGGQVEVMRQLIAQPLSHEMLTDAQQRFRGIIQRQGALKHSLDDAKTTLKDMFSLFIERLGEMSDSTAVYHEKIGVYAERIERIEDIGSLKEVLDGLMGDMRDMQRDTLRSHDEVTAARRQAEAAESKIRELEHELEEISEKVREDALTGSLNRHGLDEALIREAARAARYGSALCVSVIDIDNFKKLNDTYGHSAGDDALVHLVRVGKALLRPSDTLGRFGGEEFVVLLPETTLDAGRMAIERLQRELTKQFFLANNEKLLITFSAGVVQLRPGESEAEVVRRADQAMYRAKAAGKNRVVAEQ